MLLVLFSLLNIFLGFALAILLCSDKIAKSNENKIMVYKLLNKYTLKHKDYQKWLEYSDLRTHDYEIRKLVNKKVLSELEGIMSEFLKSWLD